MHWYCEKCNVKSVELFTVVFNIQEKMQQSEMELEKMKNETNAKFQKIETEYDAMRQDLRTLNKKIEEGVQKCLDDSDKLVKSTHQQTMSEIKDEIAEVKTVSLAEIMKQELEKSLGNMANEISTVKTNLHETKEEVDEQRDKERRRNNIIIYNIPESLGERADGRIKDDISFCLRMFNNVLQAGVSDEDLLHVFRLGKRDMSATLHRGLS